MRETPQVANIFLLKCVAVLWCLLVGVGPIVVYGGRCTTEWSLPCYEDNTKCVSNYYAHVLTLHCDMATALRYMATALRYMSTSYSAFDLS